MKNYLSANSFYMKLFTRITGFIYFLLFSVNINAQQLFTDTIPLGGNAYVNEPAKITDDGLTNWSDASSAVWTAPSSLEKQVKTLRKYRSLAVAARYRRLAIIVTHCRSFAAPHNRVVLKHPQLTHE